MVHCYLWWQLLSLSLSLSLNQAHPNQIQILMAVVKYKTKLYKPRQVSWSVTLWLCFSKFFIHEITNFIFQGVCSTWIASLDPYKGKNKIFIVKFNAVVSYFFFYFLDISETVHIPVWVVPGTISFPRQQTSHVIMVGPGTGCAPFRAYIEERVKQNAQGTMYWPKLLIYTRFLE